MRSAQSVAGRAASPGVLGYSAIRTGVAYLPFPAGVVIGSALASPLVPRIGPRPLILAGAAMVAGGTFWLSKLTEHAGYASHLLGPQLVSSFGLGLVFVPLALVALHNVAGQDSGVASSLLNTAQQVGGAIGLALLGTIAWTTVADSVRTQVTAAAAGGLGQFNTAAGGLGQFNTAAGGLGQFNTAAGGLGQFNTAAGGPGLSNTAQAGRPLPKPGTPPPASIYDHALAVGFSRGFLVAAAIGLLATLIGTATIRVRRQDLADAVPDPQATASQPAVLQPGTEQRHEDQAALAAAVRPCRLC